MRPFPKSLQDKIDERQSLAALRVLPSQDAGASIDFSSNDYLGFARSSAIFDHAHQLLSEMNIKQNGATGSRLISGNHPLYQSAEQVIAKFHDSESALLFNSGYDANVGFFSSVPQRGDVILYDALCHASIRDGIRLSNAKAYKFAHNDLEDLEILFEKFKDAPAIYVVTESVFSMDGDCPPAEQMIALCEKHGAFAVIDEAHALGVFGENGEGLFQMLDLHDRVFARLVTFGKGLGCHGAAIVGSQKLSQYLVNFARSFIYTTGLPPHSIATVVAAYGRLKDNAQPIAQLKDNISFFNREKAAHGLKPLFVYSKSAIQSAIIPGNQKVRSIASDLQKQGFDVRAILSPTVPEGQERLRICLHSYNSEQQISGLLSALAAAL